MNIDLGVLGPVVLMRCEYRWEKYNCLVVFDGFTKSGIRVHVVDDVSHIPKVLDNAVVISVSELGECRL